MTICILCRFWKSEIVGLGIRWDKKCKFAQVPVPVIKRYQRWVSSWPWHVP
jgi:hypothetical protein